MNSRWFEDYSNIITLTSYLADHGWEASEVAYAVEKPWKFEEEFLEAVQELVGGEADTDETE